MAQCKLHLFKKSKLSMGLDESNQGDDWEWYIPGNDINNFQFNFRIIYFPF